MTATEWDIRGIINITSDYLAGKKVDNPRLTAELLLSHQLNVDRITLYLHFDKPLTKVEVDGYRSLVKRRVEHEPLQYITGKQEFWSLDFKVNPSVLIPRPESEILVEMAIEKSSGEHGFTESGINILDLGTGSGALAVSLATEIRGAFIWATDISSDAIEIARFNAETHGVLERIKFCQGDMWKPIIDEGVFFDLIISNPPYVSDEEYDALPAEVKDHEPRIALCGYSDGMFYIDKIITDGWRYLNPGGHLLLEMDPRQTTKALRLFDQARVYEEASRRQDYSHRHRVVSARRISEKSLNA